MISLDPKAAALCRKLASAALVVLFVVLCVEPRLGRLGHPSLIGDDVGWIGILCEGPLTRQFLHHFNDHISPLFMTWTWTLWQLGGTRSVNAPAVFTAAGYVPFLVTLLLIRAVVRRELASETAALVAVAMLSLSSWVFDETIYWYAASSFMWALALTLAAWLSAARAQENGSRANCVATVLATAAAPAFSLIGLLAGPIACLRVLTSRRTEGDQRRPARWACVLPLLGTLAYLFLWRWAQRSPGRESFVNRVRALGDFEVFQSIARAPFEVLVPAVAGFYRHVPLPNFIGWENVRELPWPVILTLTGAGLAAATAWAWNSQYRAFILCGLLFIYGGYAITLGLPYKGWYRNRISIERYHLFPHLGLVLLLVASSAYVLRRLDRAPITRLIAANVLALALILTHGAIRRRTEYYRAPDQARTLAAIDRVSEICKRKGIARSHAIKALDPLSRRTWFPHDLIAQSNALVLVTSPFADSRVADSVVRQIILDNLSPGEIESICGGANISAHVCEPVENEREHPLVVASLAGSHLMQERGGGLYIALGWNPDRGWPSFLEYQFPTDGALSTSGAGAQTPSHLRIPGIWGTDARSGTMLELWWAGEDAAWTVFHSSRWSVTPTQKGWSLPLTYVPHLEPSQVRRIRIVFRSPAIVVLQSPRLVR